MFSRRNSLKRIGAIIASVTLLLSFGLHAVQVEHEHYGDLATEHAHGNDSATHAEDSPQSNTIFAPLGDLMHHSKDEWLLLFIVSAYVTIILTARTWSIDNARQTFLTALSLIRYTTSERRRRDYLVLALARGTLNPKPF